MKILLLFPPLLGEERYGKLARAGSYLPPLGLLYIAAVLEEKHSVRVIDGSVGKITSEDIKRVITDWKPDIVGLTSYTSTFYKVANLCEMVKKINHTIITIIGGPHATACPDDSIKSEYVDYVVVGEGEKTIKELVETIESKGDISTVKGIYYKKDKVVFSTPRQERLTDLDILPYPARHFVDRNLYQPSVMHFKRLPVFSIMCGRGCPFKCTFCSCSKVFHGKVVVRSVTSVMEEIKFLVDKYGAKEIMFWDDTFGLYKKWIYELCELIKPLKITWSCWMRVDLVNQDLLKAMADSGCWNISYGVESGNQLVLDTIKKGFHIEDIKNAFRWTHEAGMEARGTLILGLPNDTWETMMDTITIAIEIEADYAQFQLLTPYPGTELWDTLSTYGEISISDLSKYTIWFPVFVAKGLTKESLLKAQSLAYKKYYIRPKYIVQRLSRIKTFQDFKRNCIGLLSLLNYFKG